MRILLACADFPPVIRGGGAITSLLYGKALELVGHDVRCVNVQGSEDRFEQYDTLTVHRLPSQNIYWNCAQPQPLWKKVVWHALENFNPKAFVTMRKEIQGYKPDIVVTISVENVNVATWAASWAESVPVAHCAHSYFLMCRRANMYKNGSNCSGQCFDCTVLSLGKKHLSKLASALHGPTRYIVEAQTARGYFPNAITAVIPDGVDAMHRVKRPSVGGGRSLRVGYIGAHLPTKGIETIGHAAHRLSDCSVEFFIAGSGSASYSSELKRLFPTRNTHFCGWVDPSAFYPIVDVIVAPSLWREPSARVMPEAMSYGVPVLAARSGGIPEIVQDDVNGFLFTPGDATELAALIGKLVNNSALLDRLTTGAYNTAELQLPDRTGRSLTDFYEKVVSRHRHDSP